VTAAAGNAYTATTCDTLVSRTRRSGILYPGHGCPHPDGRVPQLRFPAWPQAADAHPDGDDDDSQERRFRNEPVDDHRRSGRSSDVDGVCHPDASTLAAPLGPVPADARSTITEAPPPSRLQRLAL
jgi:hypothetical protein